MDTNSLAVCSWCDIWSILHLLFNGIIVGPTEPSRTKVADDMMELVYELDKTEIVFPEQEVPDTGESLPVYGTTTKKPWMDYRTVTDESSRQHEILSAAYPDAYGVMVYEGYVCVALGSAYGEVGDLFDMTIGGKTISVIKADEKQDAHTVNGEGFVGLDGHVVEMIVNEDLLQEQSRYHGDCNYIPYLEGYVSEIRRK